MLIHLLEVTHVYPQDYIHLRRCVTTRSKSAMTAPRFADSSAVFRASLPLILLFASA